MDGEKNEKGLRRKEEAKGTKAREIERNSAKEGSEEQEKVGAEAVTFRFGIPDRHAARPIRFVKLPTKLRSCKFAILN